MEDVLVTGIGVISPAGNSINKFWKSLMAGIDGYPSSRDCLPEDYLFEGISVVNDFRSEDYLNADEIDGMDRAAQFGVAAATQALTDANLLESGNFEIPVIMGTTCGANLILEDGEFEKFWFESSTAHIKNINLEKYRHCSIANAISDKFLLKGPSYVLGTSCAAGNHALGEAFDMVSTGMCKIAICGGSEALSLLPLYGFHSIKALADEKCRPFDNPPSGLILGEGAGVLILENEKSALDRNSKIYARVRNWHLNCDAKVFSSPITDGTRCKELIMQCLKNAGITPKDIDYINLHGTGSNKNDLMEANGIKQAFDSCTQKPMASSIKSMIGHTLGAAGALDNIASVMSINESEIPPITNSVNLNKDCQLDFITQRNFKVDVKTALSLSFAFGGCNVATLFEKYNGPQ